MSRQVTLVAILCKIYPGAFSGERVIELQLANGESYQGVTPRHFCWNANGDLIGEKEPSGGEIGGLVAARLIEEIDDRQSSVEIPNGEVIAVKSNQIKMRPTPIVPPSRMVASA